MGVIRLPLKVVRDDSGFNMRIEDANGQRVSLTDLRYAGVFNLRLANFVVLACNNHKALVTALENRMESCSCHFGGIDPGGFADQPCPDCDRDRALLRNAKGE